MKTSLKVIILLVIHSLLSAFPAFAQLAAPLQFVKAVKQKGPVAYRDPFGAISPDGMRFAYSDRKQLFVQHVEGGATFELEKHGAFIIALTWLPDSKHLATYEIGGEKNYWYSYDLESKQGTALWPNRKNLTSPDGKMTIDRADWRGLTWSDDGKQVAGFSKVNGKSQWFTLAPDGSTGRIEGERELIESVQWNPRLKGWAAIVIQDGQRGIALDLKRKNAGFIPVDCYGSIAFSADGKFLYYSKANDMEVVDIHQYDMDTKAEKRMTSFSRDSYGPSVAKDGSVLFKLQDYRVFIAAVDGEGGESKPITTFMAEISHWHPDGKLLSFTYGNWRRVMDDAKYPHIAQDIGYIQFDMNKPASQPEVVVRASYSEDQGMCWSPNNKWIAFHTHADGTDDLWIQPNNDASKGKPLSKGGHETGWPRWSPDGKWIVSNTAKNQDRINKLFMIGMDQDTGEPTTAQMELTPKGLEAGIFTDAQWLNDSKTLVVEYVVDPDNKEIHLVSIDGGEGKKIHAFKSDQLYSGIGLSADQQWVAFIAPDSRGNFQVYKVSIDGQTVKQLTFDGTDKAHPSGSPKENIFSFTVFNYYSIFWKATP